MKIKNFMAFTLSIVATNAIYANTVNETKSLDKVVVTANKFEQNLQEVPQSITVIDAQTLEQKGIKDIEGIISHIPNMTSINDFDGHQMNFRGLNTSVFTHNNPVVVYIDGIPTTDRFGVEVSLANVKRVEVLRGPQGTLYGRNAIGAVINIVTKEPSNKIEGSIALEYGSNNYQEARLNLSSPLNEKLFFGFNGALQKSDGWITNDTKNDDKANKSNDKKFSTYFLYKINEKLSAKYVLSKYDVTKDWFKGYSLNAGSDIGLFQRDNAEHVNFEMPTQEKTKNTTHSLALNYAGDEYSLNSVTTIQNLKFDSEFDGDFGDLVFFDGLKRFNHTKKDELTQEFRVSKVQDNLKLVGGIYFDKATREQSPYGVQVPTAYGNMSMNAQSKLKTNTQALFGQGILSVSDNIDITFGARFQKLKQKMDMKTYMHPTSVPLNSTAVSPIYTLNNEKTWNSILPKLALTYKKYNFITPYISISKGYMPGGYNTFATQGSADDNTFEPQKSTNYEFGLKGTLEKFVFSGAIFRMDIEDIHIHKAIGNGMYVTDNAKKAHSYGLEFDFTYFPTDTLEINGSFGLIEAKYDDFNLGDSKLDGERIEQTPKSSFNLDITYTNPNGFYAQLLAKHTGDMSFYDGGTKKFQKEKAHTHYDLKLGYRVNAWDIYAYGKNITDEKFITAFKGNSMKNAATFNDPRFVGVGVKYSF